jgi:glycosyltransferase involved in cell wall biosynthesis
MYEKIAISLSRISNAEIHVAGFKGEVKTLAPNVEVHPLFYFKRLSWKRFWAPWKFYNLLIKVKPEYIIVTTHDLLTVTCVYKILFGGKILYDVQENYFRNIACTNTFPPLIRTLIACGVRIKEILSRSLISHYLLAEKNYEKEFHFSKGKSTVLENKVRKPAPYPAALTKPSDKIKLLYSGTISENYGIFEAINLAIDLHDSDPKVELKIIGYCAKNEVLKAIYKKIKPYPFIHISGGNHLVPHDEILKEITSSHFGLVPYQYNKSTINCIPTKIYEYLAFGLPMLVQHNPIWEELVNRYQAGIVIDFKDPDPQEILFKMGKDDFYKQVLTEDIFWEQEEIKLLRLFSVDL